MTDNIVARLRQSHRVGCDCFGCEAADEIERLQSCVATANAYMAFAAAEIERLRARIDELESERAPAP